MGKRFKRQNGEKFAAFQQRCNDTLRAEGRIWPRQTVTNTPAALVISTDIPTAVAAAAPKKRIPKSVVKTTAAAPKTKAAAPKKKVAVAVSVDKPKRVRKTKTTDTLAAIAV